MSPTVAPSPPIAELPGTEHLGPAARLLYQGAVAGDYALRTGLASVLGAAALPGALRAKPGAERRRLEFYAELAGRADASEVFPAPPPVRVRSVPGNGPGVAGGRVELLRFQSPYVARNPELRASYARHENNRTARAQHWRHEDGPRPTLCVIHGFGASPAWFNTAFFSLREFFASGWDVLLYTLPFHGSRRTSAIGVNGADLFSHGMGTLCEAMLHAVHDFRAFFDHLEATGAPRIGVTGLSLGGYTSALLAAAEPRLDFAVPNAAVTWMPSLLDGWFPANLSVGAVRRLSGVPKELLAQALSVHSALTYPAALPKDRVMVVGGLGDRLVAGDLELDLGGARPAELERVRAGGDADDVVGQQALHALAGSGHRQPDVRCHRGERRPCVGLEQGQQSTVDVVDRPVLRRASRPRDDRRRQRVGVLVAAGEIERHRVDAQVQLGGDRPHPLDGTQVEVDQLAQLLQRRHARLGRHGDEVGLRADPRDAWHRGDARGDGTDLAVDGEAQRHDHVAPEHGRIGEGHHPNGLGAQEALQPLADVARRHPQRRGDPGAGRATVRLQHLDDRQVELVEAVELAGQLGGGVASCVGSSRRCDDLVPSLTTTTLFAVICDMSYTILLIDRRTRSDGQGRRSVPAVAPFPMMAAGVATARPDRAGE